MRNNRSRRMGNSPTGNMPVFRPGKAAPDSLVRRNAAGYPPSRSVFHRSIVFHNVENYAFFLLFRGKSAAFSVFSVKNSAKSRNSILFIFGFPHGSGDFPGCFFCFLWKMWVVRNCILFVFCPLRTKKAADSLPQKAAEKRQKSRKKSRHPTKRRHKKTAHLPSQKNSAPKNFKSTPPAKNFAVRSP